MVADSGTAAPTAQHYGLGGESPQHKALKEYVRDNPSIVGASKDSQAITEYALPSVDVIDVLFRSDHECIAVEVKSSVSDTVSGDFERGIYQTIKYLALLRAMSLDKKHKICRNIRSVLVLQGSLPSGLRELAQVLSIEVIQNVEPTEQYFRSAKALHENDGMFVRARRDRNGPLA